MPTVVLFKKSDRRGANKSHRDYSRLTRDERTFVASRTSTGDGWCRKGDPGGFAGAWRHERGISNGRYSLAGFAAAIGEALVCVGRCHLGDEFGLLCTGIDNGDSRRFCSTTGLPEWWAKTLPPVRSEIKCCRDARLVVRVAMRVTSSR